jgi:hypothetical protein
MPATHNIRIFSDPAGYATSGAAAVKCQQNPMRFAALDLLARGSNPIDRLRGSYEGAQISPVSLASLVRPRKILRTDHRAGEVSRNVDA